ncbi:hypothetical protein DOTSEDRAFT_69860 [Dothistroma septosporum NZE10]|uniref:Uncharacterized protein n=1 Tax=Dothistroma septosporum (strain NZE10 / CBS 128990) TaxID=675120 RepID=N1PX04_DOTSN|nr:hypothetical protein DOTSEDRAFT_69860 [Dothistroma septosporum NZE10]
MYSVLASSSSMPSCIEHAGTNRHGETGISRLLQAILLTLAGLRKQDRLLVREALER